MSTPYLDFQDQQMSLSFDSFHEGDNQVIELAAFRRGMCLRYHVLSTAELRISFNGGSQIQFSLSSRDHSFNLPDELVSGEGVLRFEIFDGDSYYSRSYKLVDDYMLAYSEYMFKLYAGEREAQRLERLRFQCPQPQGDQTFASLASSKYEAAAVDVERLARLIGSLNAIEVSHMFHIVNSLGDTADRRKMIDRALQNLADRLVDAQRLVAETVLAVEHGRYYRDQEQSGQN